MTNLKLPFSVITAIAVHLKNMYIIDTFLKTSGRQKKLPLDPLKLYYQLYTIP